MKPVKFVNLSLPGAVLAKLPWRLPFWVIIAPKFGKT